MFKWLRNLNFCLLNILILLEVSTIVLYFIILVNTLKYEKKDEEKEDSYIYLNSILSIFSISLSMVSIWVIIVYGVHALYFKIINRLRYYIAG